MLAQGEMLEFNHYMPRQIKDSSNQIGEKGEGKFKQVSWEEAYDAILNGTDKFTGMGKILDEEKDNRSSFLFCALEKGNGLEPPH